MYGGFLNLQRSETDDFFHNACTAGSRNAQINGYILLDCCLSLPSDFLSHSAESKNSVIRNIVKIYISVMRGTPLMLQLMIVYYSPFLLFGMNIRTFRFPAIIIGFTINYAAYFAEIFRSGIEQCL